MATGDSLRGFYTGLILDIYTVEHFKGKVLVEHCLRKHQLREVGSWWRGGGRIHHLVAGWEISEYPLAASWVKHQEHLCRTRLCDCCEDQGSSAVQGKDLSELQPNAVQETLLYKKIWTLAISLEWEGSCRVEIVLASLKKHYLELLRSVTTVMNNR